MDGIISNPDEYREELATEIRNIADRIESGEKAPTEVSISAPRKDELGYFKVEYMDVDQLDRWSKFFG